MFTTFIYIYVQVMFIQTNVLYQSPNGQLNRQPASESATGKKPASESFIREFSTLICFPDLYSMFTVSTASYD